MSNAITLIENTILQTQDQFNARLSDQSLAFDRESAFALQQLTANDYIMGVAVSNKQSVINAVTNIASIGLSLSPAKKQAYLVPRKGSICLDISYMGLIHLACSSGGIKWAQAAIVHQEDAFELNGIDRQPTHKYNPFSKVRGDIVGVYVVVKTSDGDYLTHAMSIEQVESIRDRSEAWKAYISKKKLCPWVTDFGEMSKKTVVKQAYKYWPRVERLEQAIHLLNTESDEGLATINGDDLVVEKRDQPEAPSTQGSPLLDQQQIDEIVALATEVGKDQQTIAAAYKVSSLNFIQQTAYPFIIERLQSLRQPA